MDESGKPFGFVDNTPKIYVDRGAAVAISGLSSMEGELFSSFLRRNDYLLTRPVNEMIFDFLLRMPFVNSSNISMISAGFIGGKPTICAKSPIVPQNCVNAGIIASKDSPLLRERLGALARTPTSVEASAALTAAIEDYAKRDITVGGPISILKLTSTAPPQWSGVPASDAGMTQVCDLVRALRTAITPIGSKEELDQRLKAACP
jgi:hypothetical protein